MKMTEAEYLAFERESEIKHEYVRGYVYAMAGAKFNHVRICANFTGDSYTKLRGKGCQHCRVTCVFKSLQKERIVILIL